MSDQIFVSSLLTIIVLCVMMMSIDVTALPTQKTLLASWYAYTP